MLNYSFPFVYNSFKKCLVKKCRNIQAVKTQLPSSQVSVIALPVEKPPVLQTALPITIDATTFSLSCVREFVSHSSHCTNSCLGTSSLFPEQCMSEIVDDNLSIVWVSASPGT